MGKRVEQKRKTGFTTTDNIQVHYAASVHRTVHTGKDCMVMVIDDAKHGRERKGEVLTRKYMYVKRGKKS